MATTLAPILSVNPSTEEVLKRYDAFDEQQVDRALDQAQALVLRSHHIALARAVRPDRDVKILQMRQAAVPERARGFHLGL